MMIPVVQQNGAGDRDLGCGEQRLVTPDQPPRCHGGLIVHLLQHLLCFLEAALERLHRFRRARRTGRRGEIGDLYLVLASECRHLSWCGSHVPRELAERHRCRMGFPGELVMGPRLEQASCGGGFLRELQQHGLDHWHDDPPWSWGWETCHSRSVCVPADVVQPATTRPSSRPGSEPAPSPAALLAGEALRG